MRGVLVKIGAILIFILSQSTFALSGLFFHASSTTKSAVTISTIVQNHFYPSARIKINTPGYTLTSPGIDCTVTSHEYCLFSVSDTVPAIIGVTGPAGRVSLTLCLNGTSPLSCQNYNIIITSPKLLLSSISPQPIGGQMDSSNNLTFTGSDFTSLSNPQAVFSPAGPCATPFAPLTVTVTNATTAVLSGETIYDNTAPTTYWADCTGATMVQICNSAQTECTNTIAITYDGPIS